MVVWRMVHSTAIETEHLLGAMPTCRPIAHATRRYQKKLHENLMSLAALADSQAKPQQAQQQQQQAPPQ